MTFFQVAQIRHMRQEMTLSDRIVCTACGKAIQANSLHYISLYGMDGMARKRLSIGLFGWLELCNFYVKYK